LLCNNAETCREELLLMQQMSPLDPGQVVQQVWRGDYPASWRVFLGEQVRGVSNCLTAALIVIAVPLSCMFINAIIVFFIEAAEKGGFPNDNYLVAIFGIIILGVLLALFICAWKAIKRHSNKQPKPMIVVMPDGVVGYRRKKVWGIAFTDVAHIQLRTDARGTATNYAPIIWLDLIYRGGQRGECFIEIAPREMIAQNILEAHTAFRLHCG
jgi:hypothetical protein